MVLKEYIRQFDKVEKQRHQNYWETIKRVHAKLDVKMEQQREIEDLAIKLEE